MRHLGRWGPKQGITCFRLYERDIPDFPLIVDWFADLDAKDPSSEGDAIVWAFPRTRDRGDPGAEREYLERVCLEVGQGLNISEDRVHLRSRGRQRDGSGQRQQYVRMAHKNQRKVVQEFGVQFEINLSDYLDVGLFLDHRVLRREIGQRIAGRSMLNLFAYTGAFSVHARVSGAACTTTVDLSKTYLEWYQRN
ncbi:MAG: class I SAM-dependent methyltransferase, partial [Planctomycetota bacterium]|nr:class I SAM-dependent methyltransferase [Planctomycetota bacterium]